MAGLTNSILTQIANKRLAGKAMVSGKLNIIQEEFGSFIQQTNTTIFGSSLPNNPSQTEWLIQSASGANTGEGSVVWVEFDLVTIGSAYANSSGTDNQTGAEQEVFDHDLGDTSTYNTNTFHAYALKLPSDFQTQLSSQFDSNTATGISLGNERFTANYIATGSNKFQIVPEFVSTIKGTNNPYLPQVKDHTGATIAANNDIAYYLDAASGILFVQNPPDTALASTADNPQKVRAFLYVGKYQDEIQGDTVSLHFNASEGTDFSIANNATASFVTGSGDGLIISASGTNTLTFKLNNVASGSSLFHVSASTGGGFSVGSNATASFESGSAGITVNAAPGSNKITIGSSTDNVHFNGGRFDNDVRVQGNIIAENYIVSSSITYMTQSFSEGSTIFGDTNNDTHLFTGSVNIFKTGSGFALTLETAQSGTITPASGLKITTNATSSFGTAIEATGSVSLTGSTFTWNRPSGNSSQIPLVYDATTGNIHTGSQYSTTTGTFNSFKIRANGDDSTEQGITDGNTIEFNTGSGQGINIVASDTDTLTFTVGNGVVSSSAQLSDTFLEINGDNVISSSAQLTGSFLEIYGDNVFSSSQQLPAGIISSSNLFHITVGTGETTGELISIGDTASFAASGTGLSVTYLTASNTIQYTVDPDTLVGGTTDSTTFNFTASNAVSASHAINANNAAKVILVDEENTDSDRAIVFADPATGASTLKTDNTTFRYNSADAKVLIGDTAAIITIDGQNNIVQAGTHATASILNSVVEIMDIGGAATTLNIGASTGTATIKNATINLGESLTDIVNIKGTASIDGNLIVKGQTTAIDTVNLVVEDAFIHLASGSGTSGNGGIIVERATDNTGTALFWDETNDVWAVDVSQSDAYSNSATTDAKVAFVSHSAGLPGTAFNADVVVGATDDYKKGQLYVDTSDDYGLYVYL